MAQKVDKTFVQFVKSKKHRKGDEEDEDDNRKQEGKTFLKKKNQSINYLICDKTAEQSTENATESICDFLKQNGQITIINKYKPEKHKIKNTEEDEEEEEEEESESDESDDYEQGDINHFISNKRQRDNEEEEEEDDSEQDELETLREMKATSKKNEGAGKYMGYDEDEEDYDDENEDNDEEDNNEEEEEIPQKKNKKTEIKSQPIQQQPKQNPNNKKPKKEFKTNLSNTIFIGNLPKTMKEEDIEKYFNKYGDITTVRLMNTKEGESKGFGYIDYESTKGMKTAIQASLKIKGNEIKIEEAKSSFLQGVSSTGPSNSSNNQPKRIGKKKQKAMKNKAKTEKRQKKFEALAQAQ